MYGYHLEKLHVNHFWALRSRLLLLELKTRKRSVCFSWPHNCAFFSKTAQRWAWKRREHSKLVKDDNSFEFNFQFVVLIWSDVSWQREQDPCTIKKNISKLFFSVSYLKCVGDISRLSLSWPTNLYILQNIWVSVDSQTVSPSNYFYLTAVPADLLKSLSFIFL